MPRTAAQCALLLTNLSADLVAVQLLLLLPQHWWYGATQMVLKQALSGVVGSMYFLSAPLGVGQTPAERQ
jgi:hypothetical protein